MRPLPIPKSQIFKSLQMRNTLGNPETLPGTDPMSLPCSPTWASVVANGIRGAPKYPASPKLDKSQALPSNAPSNAKPLLSSSWPLPPTTSTSSPSPSPCYKSAISSINPVWNECDTLSSNSRKHKSKKKSKAKAKQESSPSPLPSPLSSPLPLTSPSVLLPDLQQSTKNEETLQTGASVNGSPNGMYYNDNHYQKSQNGYRAHSHPHCPTPMGWRPRRVRSRTSFGSLLESDERYAPDVNWPDMSMLQSQQMDDKPTSVFWTEAENFACGNRYSSNNSSNTSSNYRDNYRGNYTSNYSGNYSSNYSPNYSGNYSGNCSSNYSSNYSPNYNSNYNSDNEHLQSVCMSPRERDRCQVAFVHNACNTDSWEMVGNSRQVWEPILRNQRSQDPSLDMPPPPPGFENFPLGKTLLSSRSRQLLGEQVSCWQQPEYTTPHPMLQPEQELREQLHFIGNHDTHLTWRPSQLRVTNGGTGDGYYVRSVSNPLLNAITKESVFPKQPLAYPKLSYWDLLCRNDLETSPNTVDLISQTDVNPFNSIDQNIDEDEFNANLNLMMSSIQ